MTEITIDLIKELRGQTGVSIMQCKKSLIEADGDIEKAKIALTKRSGEIASKKGDRELNSGVVVTNTVDGKTILLELSCETDFVSNNEDFKSVASEMATKILAEGIVDKADISLVEMASVAGQKFGERVELANFKVVEGKVGVYVHSNNSVGAVVEFSGEVSDDIAKDIAMHVTAQFPKYLKEDDIDGEERKKAEETLKEEVADKPAEMQDKILEGKMNSYFKERVLLSQGFIKDPSQSIANILPEGVEIVKYTRMGA